MYYARTRTNRRRRESAWHHHRRRVATTIEFDLPLRGQDGGDLSEELEDAMRTFQDPLDAFSIIGAARKVIRNAGYPQEVFEAYQQEAKSGDYENLKRVTQKWFGLDYGFFDSIELGFKVIKGPCVECDGTGVCSYCDGEGYFYDRTPCPLCDGTGTLNSGEECPACQGAGEFENEQCYFCDGTGVCGACEGEGEIW